MHLRSHGGRTVWLLLPLLFLLNGCGGSAADPFATTSRSAVGSERISGRLELGDHLSGVPVSLRSLDGTVLSQTTTRDGGDFVFTLEQAAPEDFRVVAQIAEVEFSAEARDYHQSTLAVNINVPTTLVSMLMQANGGLSQQQAESEIRTRLGVPEDRSLSYGIEESLRSPFSHLAFFAAASSEGGVSDLAQEIVASGAQRHPLAPFLLTRRIFEERFEGIPASLKETQLGLLTQPRILRSLNSLDALSFDPAQALVGTTPGSSSRRASVSAPVASQKIRGQVWNSIASATEETLSALPGEQILDIGWTHIADALNLNYGTTAMLEQIQDQLNEVIGLLNSVLTQMQTDDLQTAADTITNDVNTIQTLALDLRDINPNSTGRGGTPPPGATSGTDLANPGTPYTAPDEVSTLIGKLASFAAQTAVENIADLMLGTGNASNLIVSNRNLTNSQYGVDAGSSFTHAPLRNNSQIGSAMASTFNYYGNAQQTGATVIGENSHVLAQGATDYNPYSAIVTAAASIDSIILSLKKQRAQLPVPLTSDYIIVDLQAGLMWYHSVMGADTFDNAKAHVDNMTLDVGNGVVYDDWRLPSYSEMRLLQDRARGVNTGLRHSNIAHDGNDPSAGNYGYSAQGLPALGFINLDNISSNAYLWCHVYDYQPKGKYWEEQHKRVAFGLNHEHNNTDKKDSDDICKYVAVRSIGAPVLPENGWTQGQNNPAWGETAVGWPWNWTPMSDKDFYYLGHVKSLSNVRITNGKMDATITMEVITGGSFSVGSEDAAHYNLFTRTYPTKDLALSGSGAVDLQSIIWFEPAEPTGLLSVGPGGEAIWHTDTSESLSVQMKALTVAQNSGSSPTILSSPASTVTATPPARTLVAIQMYPRNRDYNLESTSSTNEQYHCLAYYSDRTIRDVTSQAVWSVEQADGSPSQAHFDPDQANSLVVDGNVTEYLNLSVAFGGKTDTSSARSLK